MSAGQAQVPIMRLFLLLTLFAISGCKSDPCSAIAAIKASEFEILKGLRSPSSAVFMDVAKTDITGSKKACAYTIKGEFDADNMYGASIRHSYALSVTWDADAEKHTVTIDFIKAR